MVFAIGKLFKFGIFFQFVIPQFLILLQVLINHQQIIGIFENAVQESFQIILNYGYVLSEKNLINLKQNTVHLLFDYEPIKLIVLELLSKQ